MGYPKGVKEYALTKLETQTNKTQIAREIKRVFKLRADVEAVRKFVARTAENAEIEAEQGPIKRLFFDIETSFYVGWFWRTGWKQTINPGQILEDKKVICICYKWQHEDRVHTLTWDKNQNDKTMLSKFVKILGEADEIVGHNIDKFDLKEIRTRCIKVHNLMFPKYRTFDTLKKARKYFTFPSNKLNELGKYLGVGQKMETGGIDLWKDVVIKKQKKALKKMVDYCKQDVILTEDVFTALNPYVDHNTNHAVQKRLDKFCCPNCASDAVKLSHTDTTPYGYVKRNLKCLKCRKFYTVSNKTYLRWILSPERDPNDKK